MEIEFAFACLPVHSRDAAIDWYGRVFGRAPTMLPNDEEAVWQVAETASVYVLANPERAGGGEVTLIVARLEDVRAELESRSVECGEFVIIPDAGRKLLLTDPDGNRVWFVDLTPSP